MLGVAPDNRGLLPDSDVARLEELGAALRKRAAANLAAQPPADNARDRRRARRRSGHVLVRSRQARTMLSLKSDFDKPVTFDHALTMEWLNDGQHVEKYAIEVWYEEQRSWQPRGPGPSHRPHQDRPVPRGHGQPGASAHHFEHARGAYPRISALRLEPAPGRKHTANWRFSQENAACVALKVEGIRNLPSQFVEKLRTKALRNRARLQSCQ